MKVNINKGIYVACWRSFIILVHIAHVLCRVADIEMYSLGLFGCESFRGVTVAQWVRRRTAPGIGM